MFDFITNRRMLIEGLTSVAKDLDQRGVSHAMWEIRNRLICGPYWESTEKVYGPEGVSYSDMLAFVSSIAVSEKDHTRPAHAKKDVWKDSDLCLRSENRVAVRWSTLLKLLVKYEVFALEIDVNQHAEWIGSYWPKHEDYEFEVTTDVHDVYDEAGLGSCMYGKEYTRWYDDNPDVVQVVRITKGGEFIGRALLWTTDDGEKYLDRVYPSDGGAHSRAVKNWAREQGYLYKEHDDMSDEDRELSVTLNKTEHGYPYMDTFKFALRWPDGKVRLFTQYRPRCETLNSTDGCGLDWDEDRYVCAQCGEWCDDTHTVITTVHCETEEWCYTCRSECASQITARGSSYCYNYAHDRLVVRVVSGDTAWSEDVVYCSHDDEYRMPDDVVMDFKGDAVAEDEAVELANGKYAHPDDFHKYRIFQGTDGEYRHVSDVLDEEGVEYTTQEELAIWHKLHDGSTLTDAINEVFGEKTEKDVA